MAKIVTATSDKSVLLTATGSILKSLYHIHKVTDSSCLNLKRFSSQRQLS